MPEPMEGQRPQNSHKATVVDDVDAMDIEPDTGVPDPGARPKPDLGRINLAPPENGNTAPPRSPLPGQLGGLNNLSKLATVPPFSHVSVGLDGFEELKDMAPFPAQASRKPPVFSTEVREQFPKAFRPDLRALYEAQTPAEEPFAVPLPPKIPKTPRGVDLAAYNTLFYQVEPYIVKWNQYEKKYNDLHASLSSVAIKSIAVTLDGGAIMEYIRRVREKDMVLEEAYRQARERHMEALEKWVNYRNAVLNQKSG